MNPRIVVKSRKNILQITKKLCGVCASISQSQRFSNFLKHSDTDVQTKLKFIVLGIVPLTMASVVLVLRQKINIQQWKTKPSE